MAALEVPPELRDADLYLTDKETAQLKRVFRWLSGLARVTEIETEKRNKLERCAILKRAWTGAPESRPKLINPSTGEAMKEAEIREEYVILANECDGLEAEAEALKSAPLLELRASRDDLRCAVEQYGLSLSDRALEEVIWEADEDMDGALAWPEVELCVQANLCDPSGLVPYRLHHILLFLMFDVSMRGEIGVDNVMAMLFARFGKDDMEAWIRTLFGDAARDDRKLTLTEFMRAMADVTDKRAEETLERKHTRDRPRPKRKARRGRARKGK